MTEDILTEVRATSGLKNAIMGGVELTQATSEVTVCLITDTPYSESDYKSAYSAVRKYVPSAFSLELKISKLTPDCAMVKRRILSIIGEKFPALASVTGENGVEVTKDGDGFSFVVTALTSSRSQDVVKTVEDALKKSFCGSFRGSVSKEKLNVSDISVEETVVEENFEAPVRTFPVENFAPIESADAPKRAL